ncbi:VWA domain-containing protein [Miltoncostaea marina]|uniref:VWA domain-containing protein n=1 Tax=Miltoncostaea marina TaxID=2843215 RepID=UPI001C3D74A0|nr:vWA domain-containing protein [Miltoncostaea marina]
MYRTGGTAVTRTIGTLTSGPIPTPAASSGPTDLAAIVDISGSMSGADTGLRRKTAVQLLVDLADPGDRLIGTAFDPDAAEIFPRTTIAGQASKNRLKRLARTRIVSRGGTSYNAGFAAAPGAMTADPLNPQTPKAAIFLTDGANGGTYDNAHLRFAFNGTGQAWPICVVQLGRGFSKDDTALLRRIARETGGADSATPSNAQLETSTSSAAAAPPAPPRCSSGRTPSAWGSAAPTAGGWRRASATRPSSRAGAPGRTGCGSSSRAAWPTPARPAGSSGS